MQTSSTTLLHFPVMIIFSLILFIVMMRIVIGKSEFTEGLRTILGLSFTVVVLGMLFGKYGANWGLPWWIYYPVPMLVTVFLPPIVLKMKSNPTILYLVLSFLSAPLIHFVFSFFLGWTEYMPFWKIPSIWSFL